MWLLWVVLGLVVLAGMSGGLALGLHLLAPRMSERKRILLASGMSAFLPMSIVFGGFLSEVDLADDEFLLSFGALVVLFFMILSVCCLPPAWYTTTRLARGKNPAPQLEADEPDLIEG